MHRSARGNSTWMEKKEERRKKPWQFPFALAIHDSTLLSSMHLRVIPMAVVVEKLSGERPFSRQLLPVISLRDIPRQYLPRKGQFNYFSHSKHATRFAVKVICFCNKTRVLDGGISLEPICLTIFLTA